MFPTYMDCEKEQYALQKHEFMTIYIPPVDLQMQVAFTWEFQSSQDYFIAAVVMLKLQITTCMRFTINSTIPKQKRKDC